MIYITFNVKPFPCMSVNDKTLTHDILFKVLAVACPTFWFLILAPTAMPMIEAATLTAGFRNLFQAFSVPLNFFLSFLNPLPFKSICSLVKLFRFLHLHLLFGHISCNFKISSFEFKSHQAWFDMVEQCPCLHFPFFHKISCHFVSENLFRQQI